MILSRETPIMFLRNAEMLTVANFLVYEHLPAIEDGPSRKICIVTGLLHNGLCSLQLESQTYRARVSNATRRQTTKPRVFVPLRARPTSPSQKIYV